MSGFVPLRSHAGSVASVVTDALGPDGVTPRGSPQAAAAAPIAMIAPPTNHCRMPGSWYGTPGRGRASGLGYQMASGRPPTLSGLMHCDGYICVLHAAHGVRSPRKATATQIGRASCRERV